MSVKPVQSTIPLLLALFVLTGCTKELEEKVATLEKDKQELQTEIEQKNKYVEEITSAINDIQGSLNAIRMKQQMVTKSTTDIESTPKGGTAQIRQNISESLLDIDNYIEENRKKMAQLNARMNQYKRQMNEYKTKMEGLETLVSNLQATIIQKEQEVAELKREVEKLNVEVKQLTAKVTEKETTIKTQETELRKAYFIIGTDEQLRDKGIIKKQGGFIGIGRSTIPASDFDISQFTRVDFNDFKELRIETKLSDVRVISTHDSDTYSLTSDGERASFLRISNPERFWAKSKFLIVLTD